MGVSEKELNKINKLYNDGDITREQADEMREQLKKNPQSPISSNAKLITEISERELAEGQYKFAKQTEANTSVIKLWVQIWSWVAIVSILLSLFLMFS
jgi:hypothetical protein